MTFIDREYYQADIQPQNITHCNYLTNKEFLAQIIEINKTPPE